MISIWANFNAQSFIHPKLSMQSSELFLYVSTCLQQQCVSTQTTTTNRMSNLKTTLPSRYGQWYVQACYFLQHDYVLSDVSGFHKSGFGFWRRLYIFIIILLFLKIRPWSSTTPSNLKKNYVLYWAIDLKIWLSKLQYYSK